jgi:hypothetical protein
MNKIMSACCSSHPLSSTFCAAIALVAHHGRLDTHLPPLAQDHKSIDISPGNGADSQPQTVHGDGTTSNKSARPVDKHLNLAIGAVASCSSVVRQLFAQRCGVSRYHARYRAESSTDT